MIPIGVVAQYTWNCSLPDENGARYFPGISRNYGSNVQTTTTAGDVLYIYEVNSDLNADCYGEVTAIDYCYQYNTTVSVEAVFNWTVLIFYQDNRLNITNIYVLESRPSDLLCVDIGGERAECCDSKIIQGLDLQNGFIFGVTESVQGNTAGATLLGFIDDRTFTVQPEYLVNTLQTGNVGLNLTVGSSLQRPDELQTGLRMLWFVTGGKLMYV